MRWMGMVMVVGSAALGPTVSRRWALDGAAARAAQAVVLGTSTSMVVPKRAGAADEEGKAVGVVLKNGLRYVDAEVGAGEALRWGQVLKISYAQSVREASGGLKKIDEKKAYLVHHGNGRTIRGLDEGLHTMRIGGRRRIEVPPNMGYVIVGLGPVPESAWKRRAFDKALSSVDSGGTVVFDVALLDAWDDDADLGYYSDNSFTGKQLVDIVERAEAVAKNLPTQ